MDIHEYGNKDARIVLVQPITEHDYDMVEKEIETIRRQTVEDFLLAAIVVNDWNKDLTPWEASAVFGKDDFGDGACDTLKEICRYCTDRSKTYYLGGYSLAGLFSLWAAYQTDLFRGVAAVSPSVWFPGFDEFMKEKEIACKNVYLSLGNREEKVRNPVMASVGDKIRWTYERLKEQEVNCILEWNEGNHFRDVDQRVAKGFGQIMAIGNRQGD